MRRRRRSSRRSGRCRGGRGLRPDPAAAGARCAAARLPQRPRLAAAALARGGADPARDPRGRRGDRASTIMQMEAGLDTGPVLLEGRDADRRQDRGRADRRTGAMGARLMVQVLADPGRLSPGVAARGRASPMPPRSTRPRRGSTSRGAPRRSSGRCARSIRRRAPSSSMAASASRVLAAQRSRRAQRPRPATVIDDGLTIACGDGAIRPLLRPARRPRRDDAGRTAARLRRSRRATPARVTRFALTVEYDGRPFMGWQRQDHGPSVQQAIEEAAPRDHRRDGRGPRRRPHRCGRPRDRRCARISISRSRSRRSG